MQHNFSRQESPIVSVRFTGLTLAEVIRPGILLNRIANKENPAGGGVFSAKKRFMSRF
jgi:hypothetical protein